jgi:hypothetical protein
MGLIKRPGAVFNPKRDGSMEVIEGANYTPKYQDKTIQCIDCGDIFTIEAGELYFMHRRGLAEPKRCPRCRQERRQALGLPKHEAVPQW